MTKVSEEEISSSTYRIIDANLNRLREGIRVVEDVCRYYKNSKELSKRLKILRHKIRIINSKEFLKHRDIKNDPLKKTTGSESFRLNIESIIVSNIKRAQESSRVLEEIFKLTSVEESQKFKDIRYELYDVEKEILL